MKQSAVVAVLSQNITEQILYLPTESFPCGTGVVASFGFDSEREEFGVQVALTTDLALKTRYELHFGRLSERFHRMTCQLKMPYRDATLPTVLQPSELLEALLD